MRVRVTLALLVSAALVWPCTVGVFSGRVTSDHRPFIWKNRDVSEADQAIRFFSGARFSYLANVFSGDTDEVWSGVNRVGFAIMNSNSFNLGSGSAEGINDGRLMKLALENCVQVSDFARLLDSIKDVGLTVPCNLGVMDSTGATAVFEAGAHSYVAFYSDSLPEGYVVRANFSMSQDTTGQASVARYLRAEDLVSAAAGRHELSCPYLIENISKDLGLLDFDPYPLPFHGRYESLPTGYLPVTKTISRRTTRSGVYITGPGPDEPVRLSCMWAILGEPALGIAVPLWVESRSVPEELVDAPTAPICDQAQNLRSYIYSDPSFSGALNSFRLAEVQLDFAPVAGGIYQATSQQVEAWKSSTPSAAELAYFSRQMAGRAAAAYTGFCQGHPAESGLLLSREGLNVAVGSRSGIVSIRFAASQDNRHLNFYTPSGRKVLSFVVSGDANVSQFDLPSGKLAGGRYFVVLDTGGRRQTAAFSYFR